MIDTLKRTVVLTTLSLLLVSLSGLAKESPEDAAAHRLVERLSPVETLQADFSQVLMDSRLQVQQEASGRLHIARPLRFRWEVDAPYAQLVVTDDKHLYVYDPDLMQVNVEPLDEALAGTPALILAGDPAEIVGEFDVLHYQEDNGDRFSLFPKAADSMYTELRLYFSDDVLTRLEILDAMGQRTLVQLSAVEINAPIDAELFRFEIPPDTDVIGDVP